MQRFQRTSLSSIDPSTGEKVDVFNPRIDEWSEHFEVAGGRILGLTPVGRATARLLNMNDSRRVELRLQWLEKAAALRPLVAHPGWSPQSYGRYETP